MQSEKQDEKVRLPVDATLCCVCNILVELGISFRVVAGSNFAQTDVASLS